MGAERVIAAVTVAVGVLGTLAAQAGTPADERTFATASTTAQSLISIGVPFIGAVVGARRTNPVYLRSMLWAIVLGATGLAASVVIAAAVPSTADVWDRAGVIVAGAFVTQVVAQLTGIGLGLLIGRAWIAAALTVVLPLALYAVLPEAARPWIAPYASAQLWWPGEFGADDWLPFLVMVVLWGPVLHTFAWLRLSLRPAGASGRRRTGVRRPGSRL
jgi:hypothetical protein